MTIYFVTRHKGAQEWAARHGYNAVEKVSHLDAQRIAPGDEVWGTLPVNLAADVIAKGALYRHLTVLLPEHLRGQELSADEMDHYGARLEGFDVRRTD